jgi:hypothetical protein
MKAVVQAMARQALRQLVGIQKTVTYATLLSSDYDPTTGEVTAVTASQSIPVVFGNYTRQELFLSPGKIDKNDRKALIIPSDFSLENVPTFGDTLTRADGEVWQVVEDGIGLDPAEALYVLQVRKQNSGGTTVS